jgi:hypothetical protein
MESPPVRSVAATAPPASERRSRVALLWEKYWWILPVLLVLLPTALAIFFLLDTPDDATLNYKL